MVLRTVRPLSAAICALSLVSVTPLFAQGNAGAYLAARVAIEENDFSEAARYFTRALVQDPKNTELMDNAILAFVGEGDIDRAVAVARRLRALKENDQVANLVLLSAAVNSGDFDTAYDVLQSDDAVGPLVDGLAVAWIQVGQGRMSAALEAFENVASQQGLQSFGYYHKALALALVGDFEGANALLSGDAGTKIPATRRGTIARAQILSQLERNEEALALIATVFGPSLDPTLELLVDRLKTGDTLGFDAVRNAGDGLAEVFFSVAGALNGETADGYTLVYSRLAEYLRPDHVDATLMTAQLLENMERFELATAAYDRIPRDNPAFLSAELGRADALRMAGNSDASIEVLQQLVETYPHRPSVQVALGDTYRRLKRFDQAAAAYDRAVELFEAGEGAPWSLYYRRGITLERIDDWTRAEADFRKALELQPDQPQVLNYLGYSFVEKRINLDEALDMIERAVAGRPNDGYITDSLGWVLYRLGRYEEAVPHMERATELMPVDPIINDHLGDVYWAVGRKREAEFQWNRAMSFDPEEKDAERIRRKLAVGLDKVLEEEGAAPIALANDN